MTETQKKEADDKQKSVLLSQAKALIDSGMEPKQVGQMLMGLTPTPSGYPPVNGGMTMEDVVSLVTLINGNRSDTELKETIAKMDKKIEDIAEGKTKRRHGDDDEDYDPLSIATKQAHAMGAWHQTMVSLGVIPSPDEIRALRSHAAAGSQTRESIEEMKEKHRHEEEMAKLNETKENHKATLNMAADALEKVGKGVASQFLGGNGDGEQPAQFNDGMEHLKCGNCGQDIIITPDTGTQVKCPKCGKQYEREIVGQGQQTKDDITI